MQDEFRTNVQAGFEGEEKASNGQSQKESCHEPAMRGLL